MDQESTFDYLLTETDQELPTKERYDYFMRPEPREDLGPIEVVEDEYLGETKIRKMTIGMTRNAKPENKKEVIAYLEPFPHTRIDTAKPLQGWYKSLHEPAGVRPRPCFTEAILTEPYGGWCLPKGSLVETPNGPTPIEKLQVGNLVIGNQGGDLFSATVLGSLRRVSNRGIMRIRVLGDSILLTPEHPIYSIDRGDYVKAEELKIGETIEARAVQAMRGEGYYRPERELAGVLSGVSLLPGKDGSPREGESRSRSGSLDLLQPGMRESLYESYLETLFDLCGGSPEESRAYEEGENVSLFEGSSTIPGSSGETSQGSKRKETLRSNKAEVCRTRAERSHRKESLKERQIYLSQGEVFQSSFQLGKESSGVSGFFRIGLGLRTGDNPTEKRRLLPARFSARFGGVYRSQGVSLPERRFQDSESAIPRISSNSLQRNPIEEIGVVITSIEILPEPIDVFDIQTTTENFYARGEDGVKSFHVHNCAVGCSFCYVNSGFRGYRGTGLITVPLDYGWQIREQLSKIRRGAAGYFSSFTDPFLPLETYYHNTENAAREFVNVGLPVFFLSRLRYPSWALDILKENPHSYAQKSINTPDPEDWRKLSPGALPLEDHMEDIRRLKKAGIYVSIQVNPIIAGVTTHDDIVKLFKKLARAGADHVIVKFVEAGYSWAGAMVTRIKRRFGEQRGSAFEELFTENIGGQRTIEEAYRMEGHRIYREWAGKYGMTYASCYEYKYERNRDGSIKNKTGVSIGREVTTSEQCHGQRVPVYTRDNGEENFYPLEECPPSGCLYCASENGGEPRCGDELAGEANAVVMKDMKIPIGGGSYRNPSNPVFVDLSNE